MRLVADRAPACPSRARLLRPTGHASAAEGCPARGIRRRPAPAGQRAAAHAASWRSRCTGGGSGPSNIRWVSTITVRSQAGSAYQDVPNPPSQPTCRPAARRSARHAVPPAELVEEGAPSPPCAFWAASAGPGSSRRRLARQHRVAAAQQHPAERQQFVGGGHQARGPVRELLRLAPQAARSSQASSPPPGRLSGRRSPAGPAAPSRIRCPACPAARRPGCAAPRGTDAPAARASSTPSTEAPVL